MSHLAMNLQVMSQVVWGVSDEELAAHIQRAEQFGWAWDGQTHWRRAIDSKIGVAVLTSLAAVRAVEDPMSPRLLLTRV